MLFGEREGFSNKMSGKTRRYDVFFVDDGTSLHDFVSEELKGLGCKVSCFCNASECLDCLRRENCNLLITGLEMSDMDGMTLLSRVKHTVPWVSVMVISEYGDVSTAVRAIKLGAVDFVEKPLEKKSFVDKVASVLRQDEFADVPVKKQLSKTEKKV